MAIHLYDRIRILLLLSQRAAQEQAGRFLDLVLGRNIDAVLLIQFEVWPRSSSDDPTIDSIYGSRSTLSYSRMQNGEFAVRNREDLSFSCFQR